MCERGGGGGGVAFGRHIYSLTPKGRRPIWVNGIGGCRDPLMYTKMEVVRWQDNLGLMVLAVRGHRVGGGGGGSTKHNVAYLTSGK